MIAVLVVEGDVELVGESIDNGSADAETSEGAGAREKSELSEIVPSGAMFGKFVANEGMEAFGEMMTGFPSVFMIIETEDSGRGGGVEIKFHKVIIAYLPLMRHGYLRNKNSSLFECVLRRATTRMRAPHTHSPVVALVRLETCKQVSNILIGSYFCCDDQALKSLMLAEDLTSVV